MSVRLKFGVVGTGVGSSFISGAASELAKEGFLELTGVVARSRAKTEEFARKYGFKAAYLNIYDMISSEKPDIVAVSAPHYAHFQIALEAIENGVNVLVDKPMAINLTEADELIRRAETRDVKLGVIFQSRFDDAFNFVKSLADGGSLGRLIMGEAVVEWYRTEEYYKGSSWRGRLATEGGGALINQAIHTIDLLLWIMGEPGSVWAKVDTVGHNIEVEDLAAAVVRFRNGPLGIIQASPAPYPRLPTRLDVHGLKGTVIVEGDEVKFMKIAEEISSLKPPVKKIEGLRAWERPEAVPIENHKRLLKDFVSAILEDRKPRVDGYEGRRSLELIRAIYKSSATGEVVNLPLKE
ncbi:MAG: Gfo/Idh/MocA family oxidoreductase [Candidatus Bathyarchaeia archaeon]